VLNRKIPNRFQFGLANRLRPKSSPLRQSQECKQEMLQSVELNSQVIHGHKCTIGCHQRIAAKKSSGTTQYSLCVKYRQKIKMA